LKVGQASACHETTLRGVLRDAPVSFLSRVSPATRQAFPRDPRAFLVPHKAAGRKPAGSRPACNLVMSDLAEVRSIVAVIEQRIAESRARFRGQSDRLQPVTCLWPSGRNWILFAHLTQAHAENVNGRILLGELRWLCRARRLVQTRSLGCPSA
jgi:hypothetical protein